MSGGYRPPDGDGLGPLLATIRDLRRRLDELEAPTGTSMGSLVAQVQAALADLSTQVASEISAQSYTKTEIDAKIASPGNISPGTVTASGAVASSSTVSGTTGTFNSGLKSTDVYSHDLTYGGGYTATWCHSDGTLGTVPSSRRFKQDIGPNGLDLTALDRAEVVAFRYKAAVENLGDAAEWVVGGIAEQFVDAGLEHTVMLDDEGLPYSIEDRPLLYTLLAGYQDLARRLTAAGL